MYIYIYNYFYRFIFSSYKMQTSNILIFEVWFDCCLVCSSICSFTFTFFLVPRCAVKAEKVFSVTLNIL